MDNLSSRDVAGVGQAIEAVGSGRHYLWPCSPDLNPIEAAFSLIVSILPIIRTITIMSVDGDLWQGIGFGSREVPANPR